MIGENGAPGEIRTPDPLLRRQMLYPAELRARKLFYDLITELAAWDSDSRKSRFPYCAQFCGVPGDTWPRPARFENANLRLCVRFWSLETAELPRFQHYLAASSS